MFPGVVTKDPAAVEVEAQAACLAMFPRGSRTFVPKVFRWAVDCFLGRRAGYLPVDAGYHDLEHTLQGTLCFVRLMRGRHQSGVRPRASEKLFQLGLLAILLHDTGYLKRKGDVKGTGAKYTATHVARSVWFAEELLRQKRFAAREIKAVQNMILCTGPNTRVERLPFRSETERFVAFAVGTADLLGQMAADDYVDKLPVLYEEFVEAASHEPEEGGFFGMFSSADDLMQKTPAFWEKYVQHRLDADFAGVYRFLSQPYPSGPNSYLERIEANVMRLRHELVKTGPVAGR